MIYKLYQLFIALPLLLIATISTAIVTIIGCALGGAKTWGYYPAMVWSRLMCWVMLLPVKVEGRELLDSKYDAYLRLKPLYKREVILLDKENGYEDFLQFHVSTSTLCCIDITTIGTSFAMLHRIIFL